MLKNKSYKIDITPSFETRLTSMKINEVNKGIYNRLEANATFFYSDKKQIIIISIDTLFISFGLKKFILSYLEKKFKLNERNVWIMATHTHFAPTLEEKRFDLGVKDEKYFEFLKNKLIELFDLFKINDFIDVKFSLLKGEANGVSINRRRKVRRVKNIFKTFISMEMNKDAFRDETISIIKIRDINNVICGVIWSFACHPTNLFDNKLLSSEFPGEVRTFLRTELNDESLPIIFMQGFAGNIRARPPENNSLDKKIRTFLQLSYPVKYYRFQNEIEYKNWVNSLLFAFNKVWQSEELLLNNLDIEEKYYSINIKNNIGIDVEGVDELIFRKLNFGKDYSIIAISAEVVSEYTKILQEHIQSENCTFIGYTDEVFGYLPSNKLISEGGYEAQGYFNCFKVKGKFKDNIENKIIECVKILN